MLRFHQLAGSRTVKTGFSVFITAWICMLLNWPPVFAVITAIVTLEPTVADSIRKGVVRFPASAIGSAYAVLFIYWFGNSPLTYTLAAVFTIITCFKLRLHAGLLVATITAVAMVEVIDQNLVVAFLIRLGTTTTGLVVSTLVNMFIFPPDYTQEIAKNIQQISKKTSIVILLGLKEIVNGNSQNGYSVLPKLNELDRKLTRTELLVNFQKDEAKYHPLAGSEKDRFNLEKWQINKLELIHYHLYNLIYTPLSYNKWSDEERSIILNAVNKLSQSLKSKENYDSKQHQYQLDQLMQIYWLHHEELMNREQHPTYFPPELIIVYELVSIHSLVRRYYELKS